METNKKAEKKGSRSRDTVHGAESSLFPRLSVGENVWMNVRVCVSLSSY